MEKKFINRAILISFFLVFSIIVFGNNHIITLGESFNPSDTREIGYEFLDNNSVVHIWNTQDDYFFEKDSGIQLTNHYQAYWTRNVFCIGYYSGGEWHRIKCSDELTNFNKDIYTDNSSFVNATLWKDISYNGYDLRFGVNYYLGLDDENLSITVYGKNIGIDIPFDLGFAWKVKDIDVPSSETTDTITINQSQYKTDGIYNITFKDMTRNVTQCQQNGTYGNGTPIIECSSTQYPISYYKISDVNEGTIGIDNFLRIDWDDTLDYAVRLYGDGNPSNSYSALLVNAGHLSPNQEKSTTFHWIDALTDNILSYWTFNESSGNFIDIIGWHNATPVAGVRHGQPTLVSDGGGYSMYTKTNSSSTETNPYAAADFNSGITFAFWTNSTPVSTGARFVTLEGAFYVGEDALQQFFFGVEGTGKSHANSTTKIDGNTHFVVGTWNSNGTLVIYIDGAKEGTWLSETRYNLDALSRPLVFGANWNGASDYMNGNLDEFAIYQRDLTPDEVSTWWNSGNGLTYPFVPSSPPEGDTTPPNVTINSPLNSTYISKYVIFNVTALDLNMSNCSYSLNGGTDNFTMTNLSTSPTQFTATNTTIALGEQEVTFFCTDILGNINNTETVDLNVQIPTTVVSDSYVFMFETSEKNIVRDSEGNLHLVYEDSSNDISYCNSSTNGLTWSCSKLQSGTLARAGIVVNSTDGLFVYFNYASDRIDGKYSIDGGVTWEPSFKVFDSASAYSKVNCVVDKNDIIHCVSVLSYSDAMYVNSTSFDNEVVINDNGADDSDYCDIEVNASGCIYVVCTGTDEDDVDFWNTCDAGFGDTNRVTIHSENTSLQPAMITDSSNNIYVSWILYRDLPYESAEIWFANSSDGGTTWTNKSIITSLIMSDYMTDIAVTEDGDIYVLVSDETQAQSLWMAKSSDGGVTWTNKALLTKLNENVPFAFLSIPQTRYPLYSNKLTNRFDYVFQNVTTILFNNFSITYTDSVNPSVTITNPKNASYNSQSINFNITVGDLSTIAFCNYTLDNGLHNNTMTNTSKTKWGAINNSMVEGDYNVTFYCDDSSGNHNNTEQIFFNVDLTNPDINITYPINNTNWTNVNLNINFTRSDANLFNCWYSNDTYLKNSTPDSTCNNITSIVWSEGLHNVTVWANDSAGNINASRISFTIDTTNPNLNITFPINKTNSSNSGLDINFTRSDANLESCWYSNDTYLKNTTLTSCTNITSIIWTEAKHNVTIWVNDTYGNINKSSISFTIDETSPNINITNPISFTNSLNVNLDVNYTVVDNHTDSCWYSNDSYSVNVSLTDCGTNITGINWSEGQHNVLVYANDTFGNIGSRLVVFTIDLTPPSVTIINPLNNSYTNSNITSFNVTTIDNLIDIGGCNYSLNNGLNNISMTSKVTFQENPNGSAINGDWTDGANTYDGNWGTYGVPTYHANYQNTVDVVLTYTKPSGSSSDSLWQIKGGEHSDVIVYNEQPSGLDSIINVSIPTSCWDYNPTSLTFNITSLISSSSPMGIYGTIISFQCKDSSGWSDVAGVVCLSLNSTTTNGCSEVYEESMVWKYNAYSNLNTTMTEQNHNVTFYCWDELGNLNYSKKSYFTNDYTNPTITNITQPNGTYTTTTIPVNITVGDDVSLDSCWYNVTTQADTNTEIVTFREITNCNTTTIPSVPNNDYFFYLFINDSAGNINRSTSSYVRDYTPPAQPPSGGGGTTIIVGSNETAWGITTTTGTEKYEIFKVKGVSRTWDILFENLGESNRTISLKCVDIEGSLCEYVSFKNDSFFLPLKKGTKYRNSFTIDFPSEINDYIEIFNIEATDDLGITGTVTVEARKSNVFTGFFLKLIGASRELFGITIRYIFIFIISGGVVGLLTFLVIPKKVKFKGLIIIGTSLLTGVLLVLFL